MRKKSFVFRMRAHVRKGGIKGKCRLVFVRVKRIPRKRKNRVAPKRLGPMVSFASGRGKFAQIAAEIGFVDADCGTRTNSFPDDGLARVLRSIFFLVLLFLFELHCIFFGEPIKRVVRVRIIVQVTVRLAAFATATAAAALRSPAIAAPIDRSDITLLLVLLLLPLLLLLLLLVGLGLSLPELLVLLLGLGLCLGNCLGLLGLGLCLGIGLGLLGLGLCLGLLLSRLGLGRWLVLFFLLLILLFFSLPSCANCNAQGR